MPFDKNSKLWPNATECFFRERAIQPQQQEGPHCVSTVLAMLAGTQPSHFQGRVNTQDPSSWSEALQPWNMQLCYCPTDIRRLRFYLDELCQLDDLFTLSYYTSDGFLNDPNEEGWICGSHIVILHRDQILDPMIGEAVSAAEHGGMSLHTKRIFRVVPAGYHRSL